MPLLWMGIAWLGINVIFIITLQITTGASAATEVGRSIASAEIIPFVIRKSEQLL
jgi:hypothetical protein